MSRGKVTAAATVLVLVAAGGFTWVYNPFGLAEKARDLTQPKAQAAAPKAPPATSTVQEGPLSAQITQSGTLSYVAKADGSPYTVVNQTPGIFSRLPEAGRVAKCGEVLYRVGNFPVMLMCGSTPAYRSLKKGDEGPDVQELNANLVKLGYAEDLDLEADSDYFGWRTKTAVKRLQDKLNVDETGIVKLGDVVFLPGLLRITKVSAGLGTRAAPGMPVLQATSTGRQVTVDLDAAQQGNVKVGDRAQITLPDNRTTPAVVQRIGTVVAGGTEDASGASAAAKVPIYLKLLRPKDAGRLEQAPVQVQITTAGLKSALFVPVTALVGEAGGGYAVETVSAAGKRQLVSVTLGLFDASQGLVQVKGDLSAGHRVVVPAT